MKGAFWALCSVLLVSAAQLLLRNAMQALPPVSEILAFVSALWHFSSGTGALLLGLTGYVASMGCWYLALRCADLEGSRARLYAGAGIVRGSDPEAEEEETSAKFLAMLAAFGQEEAAIEPAASATR